MLSRSDEYDVWSRKAFPFYLAARLLWQKDALVGHALLEPAAFAQYQCLENQLKAVLLFLDPHFEPRSVHHDLERAVDELKKHAEIEQLPIFIPPNFMQVATRYPMVQDYMVTPGQQELDRFDLTMVTLLRLGHGIRPGSEFAKALAGPGENHNIMAQDNRQLGQLRSLIRRR